MASKKQAKGPQRFSLVDAMEGLQDELVSKMTHGRKKLPHPVEVGDNAELRWGEMLRSFLPKRYTVGKGFVVDLHGEVSEQFDVLIYDRQYSPQIFKGANGSVYVPAEAVYAVLEVKQDLTKKHIGYAADKVASVRRLHRTSAPVPHAGGEFAPRELHRIIGGILTLDSGWKQPFGTAMREAIGKHADDEHRLDIGCVASEGSFTVAEDATLAEIWDDTDRALVWFVTHLLDLLRPIATVPAIDIVEWTKKALA